jgi:hypothetical protein
MSDEEFKDEIASAFMSGHVQDHMRGRCGELLAFSAKEQHYIDSAKHVAEKIGVPFLGINDELTESARTSALDPNVCLSRLNLTVPV